MSDTHEVTIEVRGMTCSHCEQAVRKALKAVPGVAEVRQVSHTDGLASVAAGPEATAERIEVAVTKAGYHARVRTSRYE